MVTFKVNKDTKVEKLVEKDKAGATLFFDINPDNFTELSEEVVKGLSTENRKAYRIAEENVKKMVESDDMNDPPFEAFSINPEYATATAQMHVEGIDRKKWHLSFKRPDEVGRCMAQGYSFVMKGGAKNFFNADKTGRIIIGTAEKVEMYLMKLPIEKYNALKEYSRNLSRVRNNAVEDDAAEKLRRLGVKAVKGV